jgi:hypothetical protein
MMGTLEYIKLHVNINAVDGSGLSTKEHGEISSLTGWEGTCANVFREMRC